MDHDDVVTSTASVPAPSTPARVLIASLAVAVTVAYGTLSYAFAVVLVPMERDLGWSQATLTGAFSVALTVAALAGVGVGIALDRCAPRLILTAGALLGAILVVAWSRITTVLELYLVFAGLGVAMAAVLYPSTLTVATKWLGPWRQTGVTTITAVGSAASLLFSSLTGALVAALNWREALLCLAALLAATAPMHAIALRRPPPIPEEARPATATAAGAAARSATLWLLAASFALGAFVWSAMVVHLPSLLVEQGETVAFAGVVAGVMGIGQLPGRLLLGALIGRVSALGTLLASFMSSAGALALLAAVPSAPVALAFALVFGFCSGMVSILAATIPAQLYGSASFGTTFGLMSACATAARAAAPFLGSLLVLGVSDYAVLVWTLVIVMLLAAGAGAVGLGRTQSTQR